MHARPDTDASPVYAKPPMLASYHNHTARHVKTFYRRAAVLVVILLSLQ